MRTPAPRIVDEEEVAEFVAETGSSADEAALVLEAIDNLKEAVANFYKSAGGEAAPRSLAQQTVNARPTRR